MIKKEGIDLVFSFDSTGSMSPCFSEMARKLHDIFNPLFTSIPDIRIGIINHKDYCDRDTTYTIIYEDLTDNIHKLGNFVQTTRSGGGGDAPECYELALNRARALSWKAGKSRVLVMIGDQVPHETSYPSNTQHLDWRNEAKMLAELGIQVYAVQCLSSYSATNFYSELASITGGVHITLNQFKNIENLIKAVSYKQQGNEYLSNYENELKSRGSLGNDLERIFDNLQGRKPIITKDKDFSLRTTIKVGSSNKNLTGLVPVNPARFQVFDVYGTPSIREFVQSMGIEFQIGRGFYPHISRTEMIQENKEVIIEDLVSGEMFTGAGAREKIGVPYGHRGKVVPNPIPGCRVWIQSTSNNRVLREKGFLYEVSDRSW